MGLNKRLIDQAGGASAGALLDIVNYTGDGASSKTITTLNDPSLVMIKKNDISNHIWAVDDGGTYPSYTSSNLTTAENSSSTVVQSLGTKQFVIGNDSDVNTSGSDYTAYSWESNPANGFETFDFTTGPTTGYFVVNHNLGVTPLMFIVKDLDNAGQEHYAYHRGTRYDAYNSYFKMPTQSGAVYDPYIWSNSLPTASYFRMRVDNGIFKTNTNYRVFLFTSITDVMTVGSYSGTTGGPLTINLGWQPRWVFIKDVQGAYQGYGWYIHDFSQSSAGYRYEWHSTNGRLSNYQQYQGYYVEPLSTGFKCINFNSYQNHNTHTHCYMAIA